MDPINKIKVQFTWENVLSDALGESAQLTVGIFVPSLNPGKDMMRFAFSAHALL